MNDRRMNIRYVNVNQQDHRVLGVVVAQPLRVRDVDVVHLAFVLADDGTCQRTDLEPDGPG